MAKEYDLETEFRDALYKYKESKMIKLGLKGCRDQAFNIVGSVDIKDDRNSNIRTRLFQRLEELEVDITSLKLCKLCEPCIVEGNDDFLKLQDICILEENDQVLMID